MRRAALFRPLSPVPDAVATRIYAQVAACLRRWGYEVARTYVPGGEAGVVAHEEVQEDGAKIVWISDRLRPEAAARVILTEAAHIYLGHTTGSLAEHRVAAISRGTEAQRVACLAAGLLGLDPVARNARQLSERSRRTAQELVRAIVDDADQPAVK